MAANSNHSVTAMGFLTVLEHPQHGLFGGYLILNAAGRPLEFHCTAPLKANRAQQILYGPTLDAFLYGEQIGRTLLREAKTEPAVVWTDRPPVLAVRAHISLPVALVLPPVPATEADDADHEEKRLRVDGSHGSGPGLVHFQFGRNHLAVPEPSGDDRQSIARQLSGLDESFDLAEPFGRIREAIEEAQQAVRSS